MTFQKVPSNLRVPYIAVEFDSSKAVQGAATKPYRALLIGQRLTAVGTVAELVPTRLFAKEDAAVYFGEGSQLYDMAAAWFAQNRTVEVWAVALDDAGGSVKATQTATVTGAATAAGTVFLYIAGKRLQVGVSGGDTATTIGDAIAAVVNADPLLPMTAANVTGTVTLTAKHGGTIGNDVDVRLNYNEGETLPTGVQIALAAGVTGATDPDLDEVWPVLGETQYDVIALPLSDTTAIGSADTELEDRWGPMRPIDGFAFAGKRGALAALASFGSGENSKHVSVMGAQSSPSSPWAWAAAVAGQVAPSASNDPARPFQTLPLVGIVAPTDTDVFDVTEANQLLFDGISAFDVANDGTVRIRRLISLYQENAGGADDTAFLDVNTHRTLGLLRWSVRNRLALRFPNAKLGDDGDTIVDGVATPSSIRLELVALAREWVANGWMEGIEQFQADLEVVRDPADPNRVNVKMPPDLINQLRVIAARMEFIL